MFHRHAYVASDQPVVCPLDEALSLPQRCYSDLWREWMSYGTTDEPYRESQTLLERVLGLSLSLQALETTMVEEAVDVEAYYEQPRDPAAPASTVTVLVAQSDGKGMPRLHPEPVAESHGEVKAIHQAPRRP